MMKGLKYGAAVLAALLLGACSESEVFYTAVYPVVRVEAVVTVPSPEPALGIKGIPCHTDLFTSFIWLLVVVFCTVRLLSSNFGNVLKAVRDDEIAAQVMGINVFHTKLFSFCLGAFLAGVGGALLGNLLTTIDPKMFTFLLTYNILMIVVAGGLGSISGSIIGSVIITVLLEWLRVVEEPLNLGFVEIPGIPGMRMVVFSVCLLVIILYRREGIMGMREITWDGIAAFLSRFPEQGRNRAHNQSDKQPHGHCSRLIQADGNPLGKSHKSYTPACNQRRNPPPVLRDGTPGIGQNFHHGLIDIKYHRQHTGGNARQNRAGSQKDSAQSIPQPSHH